VKIPPYTFQTQDLALENFRNSVTTVWNYGKYQIPIVTAGTPTWDAQPGENVLFRPASGGMSLFVYVQASAWLVLISATT